VTPGQYLVLYDGAQCLGGATIVRSALLEPQQKIAV
jgi:tRNA U34 2-thiouridine synthase MnmA/TrmU